MFFALDVDDRKVNILSAEKGKKYYCPCCKQELIQKNGAIRVPHFAHRAGSECSDGWHYEMSEWHLDWQSRFPEDCREVVMTKDGVKHRADVFINNKVIEFQHSEMSNDEFWDRNEFYTGLGYDVIWVFDLQEYWGDKIFYRNDTRRDDVLRWNWAKKTFNGYDCKEDEKITLYFQALPTEPNEFDDPVLGKVCSNADNEMKHFIMQHKDWLTAKEFVAMCSKKTAPVKYDTIEFLWNKHQVNGCIKVKNALTHEEVEIKKDPRFMREKYRGKIYGDIKRPGSDEVTNEQIINATAREWVLLK